MRASGVLLVIGSVSLGFFLGAVTVAVAQPRPPIQGASGLVRTPYGDNKVGRWKKANCPTCREVDVPAGSAADVLLAEIKKQLDAATASIQARNAYSNDVRLRLGYLAATAASAEGVVYQDPPAARTIEAQIDARLGYVCERYGLSGSCQ